jgi:hypothetical protein
MENETISKATLFKFLKIFKYRYRLTDEDAWDCVTILFEKAKWRVLNFPSRMLHYAYVDHLRIKYSRRAKGKDNSALGQFKINVESHDELHENFADLRYMPDRKIDDYVKFIKNNSLRDMVATSAAYTNKDKKRAYRPVRPISIRRIIFRYYLGYTMWEIGEYCGLSESRLSQIIDKETKRLVKLILWH